MSSSKIESQSFINKKHIEHSHASAKKAKHNLLHSWCNRNDNQLRHSAKTCAVCDTHTCHSKDRLLSVKFFDCDAIECSPLNFSKQDWGDCAVNSSTKAMLQKQCTPNFGQQFDRSKDNLQWMRKLEKFMLSPKSCIVMKKTKDGVCPHLICCVHCFSALKHMVKKKQSNAHAANECNCKWFDLWMCTKRTFESQCNRIGTLQQSSHGKVFVFLHCRCTEKHQGMACFPSE